MNGQLEAAVSDTVATLTFVADTLLASGNAPLRQAAVEGLHAILHRTEQQLREAWANRPLPPAQGGAPEPG